MRKKQKNHIGQRNAKTQYKDIDENTLTQAIVKAYQIIEGKKKEGEKVVESQQKNTDLEQEKWYMRVLFGLNVLFFPWKINKRFNINNQIYDSILVLFVSFVLVLIGTSIWLLGAGIIAYGIVIMYQSMEIDAFGGMMMTGMLFMVFGSLCYLAGDEFSKVSDSNRIYAYSASILALISCVVAVVSLIKQFR